MMTLLNGWGFMVAALILITGTFALAIYRLTTQLNYVKALADHLGYDFAMSGREGPNDGMPRASLYIERVRDEANVVRDSFSNPAWAIKQLRSWQMSAQRLEPALAFWVDLLRQLGLLFTVLGLGLSLAIDPGSVTDLLRPLGLAVWTTVAGLFYSILLTAQFGMKVTTWADTCERNIEAWDNRRRSVPPPENAR